MAIPFLQAAWTLGEVSPDLFARADLARFHLGASTMRNMWSKYSGGAYSRAGTAFTGFSKQTGRTMPPRLLPFQFSINQGLALEFGNFYMRVISNGAYVTEGNLAISDITQASPAVLTVSAQNVTAATPNTGGVTVSYAPNDLITLAGGVGTPAVLKVTNTKLVSIAVAQAGIGNYAPADTISPGGGTQSTPAVLTVVTTKVVSATVAAGGAGGTPGTQTVTGTTGTGTKFQASVTISGAGAVTAVLGITVAGSYTVNPTTPATEPVTGAGAGAQLNVVLGVATVSVTTPGVFTTNPTDGVMTQTSSSGTGTGATFSSAIMAPNAVSVRNGGAYTTTPGNPVLQSSTTGLGVGATFTCTFAAVQPFNAGDWLSVTDVVGMTQVNNRVFVVGVATATTVTLYDVYGNPVDSSAFSAYLSGGFVARIYTAVSPYAEADLQWLKITQSADVMSICCINQETNVSYQPEDLSRFSDTDWQFIPVSPAPTISPPGSLTAAASAGGAAYYQYVVTAVNATDGTESIASIIAYADAAVNVSATAGSITLTWSVMAGASGYRIYKGLVNFSARAPAGIPFGLVGTATDVSFIDTGLVPDFNTAPPQAKDPFNAPQNYPATVAYFQDRRVYASTLSEPDTYFMSQPGSFTNFDVRNPPIDSDAITGSPWSVQVDGVQFMVDMPGGLVVLTGREAWQLTGTGGSSLNPQPVTPSTQQAQPQAFNGCHNHVPPIRIDYDILYVQSKGSIVRDLAYQFYQNIYTGVDLTLNSSHLFTGLQLQEWAWAEEPYKLVWVVREDGVMLSLTYVKPEGIAAWARHDTEGYFKSVCSITEPPVDAVYVAVERVIGGHTAYTIERMDNRIWDTIDQCWCVDCGLSLNQPQPAAALTISSFAGLGACSGAVVNDGGTGWSALTQASVVDDNGLGTGTGAVPVLTIVGGVITAVTFSTQGTGYSSPKLVLYDPAGSEGGTSYDIDITLDNSVTLQTSAPVFSSGSVGSVVRAANGIATITSVSNSTTAVANVTSPFVATIPDTADDLLPVPSGQWTLTAPVSTVTGLIHLAGTAVTGVADGQVIPSQVVSAQGTITLQQPASNIVIGLAFRPQLQSLYLDTGTQPTAQGQRKKNAMVTARVRASRGFTAGANQPDGSTLSPMQVAPTWTNMTAVPDAAITPYNSSAVPLFTGDIRVALPGGFNAKGQVAFEQPNPLPMDILGLIAEVAPGDTPQVHAKQSQNAANMAG